MQRANFASVKASSIPVCWNIPPNDQRVMDITNEVQRRLLMRGRYFGTYGRWTIAVTSQWLSLPPEIDTLEKIAESQTPLTLRGMTYEFNANGWGTRDTSLPYFGINDCIYRGNHPTVAPILIPGTLDYHCDVSTDVGKTVLLLGIDVNGNYVRTQDPITHVWSDGEVLTMTLLPTDTANQYSKVLGIQFIDSFDGQWWLKGAESSPPQLLGQYQYWDRNPSWKRYLVPFISGSTPSVEVVGKKAFVPVTKDTDYLVVGNLDALKLGGLAVLAEERQDFAMANVLWNGNQSTGQMGALTELEYELSHHLSESEQAAFEVRGSNVGQTEIVPTLI